MDNSIDLKLTENRIDFSLDFFTRIFIQNPINGEKKPLSGLSLRLIAILLNHLSLLRSRLAIRDYAIVETLDDKLLKKLAEGALSDPCIVTNPRMLTQKEVTTIYGRILRKKG